VEIKLDELEPSTRYHYCVRASDEQTGQECREFRGSFHTQRQRAESYVFTVSTDSHLVVVKPRPVEHPFFQTINLIRVEEPDFHVTLGDEAMTHAPSFIAENHEMADRAYMNFRKSYGPLAEVAPFFFGLGNHEGEGWIDEAHGLSRRLAEVSRAARMKYIPNPQERTYAEGGSAGGNYFAWTWGDALFVAIDPFTHSTTKPDRPEAWTLGDEQMKWLETVLETSEKKWKILFQHHLVGGSTLAQPYGPYGVYENYGRGGGSFAKVGEQGRIHDLMIQCGGSIVFKGHDHVYADEVVDGVHYTTCGCTHGERNKGPQWIDTQGFRELYPGGFTYLQGYIRVEISTQRLEVEYVDHEGSQRGIYTITG
jgi:hypothetical protein